jgi:hypothetical protein
MLLFIAILVLTFTFNYTAIAFVLFAENHMKRVNALCGRNAVFLDTEIQIHIVIAKEWQRKEFILLT